MTSYDTIGRSYASHRQADPRIAAAIERALGDARSVINVGAGTGSYESADRDMLAVEPSAVMIAQRPPDAARCIEASVEALPVADGSYDAALAVLTMHHWQDRDAGLRELRRVVRRRIVMLTWVPDGPPFWLTQDYFPEIAAHDRKAFPDSADLAAWFGRGADRVTMAPMPLPHDCADGFLMAYWRRPEAYLDPAVRAGISSFARFDPSAGLMRLAADLASGEWEQRYAHWRQHDAVDLGYRLVTCEFESAR